MKQKLRKTAALLLVMLMCVNLIPVDALADSSTIQTVGVDVTYGQTNARTMLAMINDFRTGDDAWAWNSDNTEKVSYTGLSELVYDYELEKIAMQRAAEIAISFSHTRPNGSSCFTLYNFYYTCGENIAAGYTTAEKVFNGWQETDEFYEGQGHRRNMLNSRFTAVGIGHVYYNGYHYWVQEFRAPASDLEEVSANDSLTRVNVELLMSDTTVSVSGAPETLSVICGETVSLPELDIRVRMTDTWPYITRKVYADYEWTAADGQHVSVSGNTVTGIKSGTTTLTTTVLGETVLVPVTVAEPPEDLSDFTVTLSKTGYIYDGTAKTPEVTVKNGSVTLAKDTDYTVNYSNNINAGTAKVTVTGKGNYTGTIEKTFTIEKAEQKLTADISADSIKAGETAAITANGIGAISYSSDNTAAAEVNSRGEVTGKEEGTAVITVRAAGNENYKETVVTITVTVTAAKKDISGYSAALSETGYTYDGTAKTPAITVKNGSVTLVKDTDYTVSYSNNINAGTAKVTVTGKGNYTGIIEKTFTIAKAEQKLTATISSGSILYGKTAAITTDGKGTISYESGNTGIATVSSKGVVTGKGAGKATITVIAAGDSNYEAASAKITVTVSLQKPSLSGVSNTSKGVTVKWKAVAGAEKYRVFRRISGGSWDKVGDTTSTAYTDKEAVSGTAYIYTVRCITGDGKTYASSYDTKGKSIKYLSRPSVTSVTNVSSGITVKWKKVTGASGYYVYRKTGTGSWKMIQPITKGTTLSFTDTGVKSSNGTTCYYKIKAYSGSYTSSDSSTKKLVRLTTPSITKATNSSSRKMTVTWSKNSKATGYQIKYVTGSTAKTVTVKSASTVSKVISGLTKGKTYKVYVRSYKTVSGTNYYSGWSSAKSVKITK